MKKRVQNPQEDSPFRFFDADSRELIKTSENHAILPNQSPFIQIFPSPLGFVPNVFTSLYTVKKTPIPLS